MTDPATRAARRARAAHRTRTENGSADEGPAPQPSAPDSDADPTANPTNPRDPTDPTANPIAALLIVLVAAVGLYIGARTGAAALLSAVAAVQAVLIVAWAFGTGLPGRVGALVISGSAAAAADVAVSVWPHSRLGAVLGVLAVAVAAMFVHQLSRGAARVRIGESLGTVALLVTAVTGLPALIQLRHEFPPTAVGAQVAAGVVAAISGALVVGWLVDMVMPAPRFDPAVPRGVLALVASAGLGGIVGHLQFHAGQQFLGARGAFLGAALGALAGLFAVASAFLDYSSPAPGEAWGRRLRPALTALLPIGLVAPVGFLLCLALRA
ncbi:MAG: hypothetical protein M3O28_12970 [Actinomycetota bacterium]|nr:hypothetical protein [Actinomycetota bacterium]